MLQATYIRYPLKFHRPAGTSRGVLTDKPSWFIRVSDDADPSRSGIGEASLIPGLSPDNIPGFEQQLKAVCRGVNNFRAGEEKAKASGMDREPSGEDQITPGIEQAQPGKDPMQPGIELSAFPAIRFGLETALRDLAQGGERLLYPSGFTAGLTGIPINGLIWMGSRREMLSRIAEKRDQGFRVLKMKVGAIDFHDEQTIIEQIRTEHGAADLELRLDANGAWQPGEAREKLQMLARYGIHSIEQPISAGLPEAMARICADSPIPVALDEELIGVTTTEEKRSLLETVRPPYIILKPSLLGGLNASEEWIRLAEQYGTGWWVTSALESNIGLNAIAQWTATLDNSMPQGLGTGMLFANNIPSPLTQEKGGLWHRADGRWDLSSLKM